MNLWPRKPAPRATPRREIPVPASTTPELPALDFDLTPATRNRAALAQAHLVATRNERGGRSR